ncbi:MAG: protein translocase subunit SecF, partial [Oscillospiraceae bacterium]
MKSRKGMVFKMFKNSHFDFIGKKKIFFTISICIITFVTAFAIIAGVKVDIQFKGGTIINYSYSGDVKAQDVEKIAKDATGSDVKVDMKKGINGKDNFDITFVGSKGLDSDKKIALSDAMTEKYGDKVKNLSSSSVNPVIGKEFFQKSMVAIIFGSILLIVYIAIRFKKISGWSAGVMAVLALAHDVIVIFGVFVVCRIPIDYNFIAVILTIIGYSINDTIVIYDRIRENKQIMPKSTPLSGLVNASINQTLSRTINTTVSTMISMVVVTIVTLATGVTS